MKIGGKAFFPPNEFSYFAFKLAVCPQHFRSSKMCVFADFGKIFSGQKFLHIFMPI